MRTLFDYFFKGQLLPSHSRVFKMALYLFVIGKCCYWLLHYGLLFGNDSIIYKAHGNTHVIKDLVYILYNNRNSTLALYFILAAAFVCFFMLYQRKTNLAADLALWLIVENLHFDIYATLTGADYLLNQFLFFNVFIAMDNAAERGKFRELYVCLHNGAVTGVIIQVFIVYLVAGLTKLQDTHWMSGEAVEKISRLNHFSTGYEFGNVKLNKALCYIALYYQLLFPILIWIRILKRPLLILGVLMHLYIAVFVGLPAFGIIMILSYIYFWPANKIPAQN